MIVLAYAMMFGGWLAVGYNAAALYDEWRESRNDA